MAGGRGGFATASVAAGSDGAVTAARAPDGVTRVTASEASAEVARGARSKRRQWRRARGRGVAGGRRERLAPARGGRRRIPAEAVSRCRTQPGRRPEVGCPVAGPSTRKISGRRSSKESSRTGTRTTTTIAAGSIGNEQPIQIVSEQWFSPDLKVLVMTKHSDPRSGETTYRLTNIVAGRAGAVALRSAGRLHARRTRSSGVSLRCSRTTSCIECT